MSAYTDLVVSAFGPEAQVEDLFDNEYRRSSLQKALAWIKGKKDTLQDIASLTQGKKIVSSHYQGLQKVVINAIKGSEGRCEDFDASFRPRTRHNKRRWIGIASAFRKGIDLPPVELIKVGEVYVVRDGHHRISVAKAFGAESVLASVTVWDVD